MNALLIAPNFFGYEKVIHEALQKLGYTVDFIPDRPFTSSFFKACYRFSSKLFEIYVNNYYKKILNHSVKKKYKIIFIINGEAITSKIIKSLRRKYPAAKFIYFTWDSLNNKPSHCRNNLKYYDKAFTFDPNDAILFGMKYKSLFFSDEIICKVDNKTILDIDLCFVGTAHSDRLTIIRALQKYFNKSGIKFFTYIYIQGRWVYLLRKITNLYFLKSNAIDFKYQALKQSEIKTLLKRSKAILDIQHINQSGMTMRTFEALASQKKLITTNSFISQSDFYDPQNILIINRKKILDIDNEFFRIPFKPIPEKILSKYHINKWIFDILS